MCSICCKGCRGCFQGVLVGGASLVLLVHLRQVHPLRRQVHPLERYLHPLVAPSAPEMLKMLIL